MQQSRRLDNCEQPLYLAVPLSEWLFWSRRPSIQPDKLLCGRCIADRLLLHPIARVFPLRSPQRKQNRSSAQKQITSQTTVTRRIA